jgi:hypothetical protein
MPYLPPPPFQVLPSPAGINHGAGLIGLGASGLLACWYSGRSEAGPDAVILCARSRDAGAAWSAPEPVSIPHQRDLAAAAPAKSVGNVVLARDANGRLEMIAGEIQSRRIAGVETCRTWRCGRIDFRISTDGGRAWSPPTRLDDRPGALPRSRPLHAPNLGDLVPVYQESGRPSVLRLDLAQLTPGQRPALQVMAIPGASGLLQPSLATLPDPADPGDPSKARVLAYLRDRSRRAVRVARLDPVRGAWSPPVATSLPNPGSAVQAFNADPGEVALIYNPSRTGRTSLAIAFSADGVNFPRGCVIVPKGAAGDVAYPSVAQLGATWFVAVSIDGKRRIAVMRLDRAFLEACRAQRLPSSPPV